MNSTTTYHDELDEMATTGNPGENGSTESKGVDILMMITIGCLGVLGNGFVLFVMFSSKRLRQRLANILLINQSMIDFTSSLLLIGDATTKFVAGYEVGMKGLAGDVYCRLWLNSILLWGMLVSSTYNLIAITIERYMMVVHPVVHKTSFNRRRIMYVAGAIWFVGLAYIVPTANSLVIDGVCFLYNDFSDPVWQKAYGFLTVTVSYFIPMLVHPILYTHMVVVLRKRSIKMAQRLHLDSNIGKAAEQPEHKMSRAQKNLLKTAAIVTIAFFLCWTWNELVYFFLNLGLNVDAAFYSFTIAVANFNSCINPFIYIFKYEEFRKTVHGLLTRSSQVQPSSSA